MKNINDMQLNDLLTTNDVLKILNVTKRTLYTWMNSGKFPKNKKVSARKVYWIRSEIQSWLNNVANK